MRICFLGLGRMGAAMAANLVAAGHDVLLWNRSRERGDALVAQGAQFASSIREAAAADVAISMLADDNAVEGVAFGPAGIVAAGTPVHISMSTISIDLANRLEQAHLERGTALVSAPVFGRPAVARAVRLAIVAGGPAHSIERCRPLFAALGDRLFLTGDRPASANLVKLCINFMSIAAIDALAEAMTLARKGGIDGDAFIAAVTGIFPSPVHHAYGPLLRDRSFTPPGFAAPLGLKDVELMAAAAKELRSPLPLLGVVHDHLLSLLAQEGEEIDWSALLLPIERAAGLSPEP